MIPTIPFLMFALNFMCLQNSAESLQIDLKSVDTPVLITLDNIFASMWKKQYPVDFFATSRKISCFQVKFSQFCKFSIMFGLDFKCVCISLQNVC